VGCSSPFNLINLIEANATLGKKKEQYEGEFEGDELLDL